MRGLTQGLGLRGGQRELARALRSIWLDSNVQIAGIHGSIASLVSASLPAWATVVNILSVTILGVNDTSGTTRPAILYGASTPLGYLPAGMEKDLPIRKGGTYIKRISGDVTVMLEVYLGPKN